MTSMTKAARLKSNAKWRRIYEANYRDVRHQFFAHKQAAEDAEVAALFSKGTNRELQQLIAFWDRFISRSGNYLQRKEARASARPVLLG